MLAIFLRNNFCVVKQPALVPLFFPLPFACRHNLQRICCYVTRIAPWQVKQDNADMIQAFYFFQLFNDKIIHKIST